MVLFSSNACTHGACTLAGFTSFSLSRNPSCSSTPITVVSSVATPCTGTEKNFAFVGRAVPLSYVVGVGVPH